MENPCAVATIQNKDPDALWSFAAEATVEGIETVATELIKKKFNLWDPSQCPIQSYTLVTDQGEAF